MDIHVPYLFFFFDSALNVNLNVNFDNFQIQYLATVSVNFYQIQCLAKNVNFDNCQIQFLVKCLV